MKRCKLFTALTVLTLTLFSVHATSVLATPSQHLEWQPAATSQVHMDSHYQEVYSGIKGFFKRLWRGIKRFCAACRFSASGNGSMWEWRLECSFDPR